MEVYLLFPEGWISSTFILLVFLFWSRCHLNINDLWFLTSVFLFLVIVDGDDGGSGGLCVCFLFLLSSEETLYFLCFHSGNSPLRCEFCTFCHALYVDRCCLNLNLSRISFLSNWGLSVLQGIVVWVEIYALLASAGQFNTFCFL